MRILFRPGFIVAVLVFCGAAAITSADAVRQEINYAEAYDKGVAWATFLDGVKARADEWRKGYSNAAISADTVSRLRALPARRKILVVTEDRCGDSAQTVPYVARLVDAAPDRLEMRVINSRVGREIMSAHRTPDGRAATPTVIVLDAEGRFLSAWIERPAPLQTWILEQKKVLSSDELHDGTAKWYATDGGKTAAAELTALITR